MKSYIKNICLLLVAVCSFTITQAQNTKADKKAANLAEIKSLVNAQRFDFIANFAIPMGGGGRALTSSYDLVITKDTVTAYLPYFGRAYTSNYGSTDNGIKFSTTKFTYSSVYKKSGWEILITVKDSKMSDALGVRQLRLSISSDGYGSLQVTSQNRDPITFNGYIEAIKKNK